MHFSPNSDLTENRLIRLNFVFIKLGVTEYSLRINIASKTQSKFFKLPKIESLNKN